MQKNRKIFITMAILLIISILVFGFIIGLNLKDENKDWLDENITIEKCSSGFTHQVLKITNNSDQYVSGLPVVIQQPTTKKYNSNTYNYTTLKLQLFLAPKESSYIPGIVFNSNNPFNLVLDNEDDGYKNHKKEFFEYYITDHPLSNVVYTSDVNFKIKNVNSTISDGLFQSPSFDGEFEIQNNTDHDLKIDMNNVNICSASENGSTDFGPLLTPIYNDDLGNNIIELKPGESKTLHFTSESKKSATEESSPKHGITVIYQGDEWREN